MGSIQCFYFIGGVVRYERTRVGFGLIAHVEFQCFTNVCAVSIPFPIDGVYRVFLLVLRVSDNTGIPSAASADPLSCLFDFFILAFVEAFFLFFEFFSLCSNWA